MAKIKYYRNNPLLKGVGVQLEYTAFQIEEYLKCKNDPIYFIKNYVKIVHVDKGLVKFELYDYQEDVVNLLHHNNKVILNFCRQSGKTTTIAAFFLWFIIFNEEKVCAILANKRVTAYEILGRVQKAYENLPIWLQTGVVEFNKSRMVLENGSRLIAEATSSAAIRGFSLNAILLDEFAFVPNNLADEFFTSVFPTISSGKDSKIFMASCVTDNTWIYSENGPTQLKTYIDYSNDGPYIINEYLVHGKNGLQSGNIIHNNGKVPTKIIETRYSKLEGSFNHKLYAYKNGVYNWYKLEELEVGDRVAIKYGMNIWGDNDKINFIPTRRSITDNYFCVDTITPDLAYFFGLYIAEGSSNKHSIDITCGDDISHIFDNLGLRYSTRKDGIHYRVTSNSLKQIMIHLGFEFDRTAKRKIIPDRLLSISKDNIIALLQGMFDGDGCASKNGGRINYSSTSYELVEQVRILLINFGILGTISKRITKPTERVKVYSTVYSYDASSINAIKFFENIGFRFGRKQCRYNPNIVSNRGTQFDSIFNSRIDIQNIINKNNLNYFIGKGVAKNNVNFSRNSCLKIKNDLNNLGVSDWYLDNIVLEDLIWVDIKTITNSENYTYDFSLPDSNDFWCHSVIYNGILGHQTPNGMNHFYKMYKDGEEGRNGFVTMHIKWDRHPDRDEAWADEQRKILGDLKFAQEMEADFQGSSNTLLNSTCIKNLTYKTPILVNDNLKIYEAPIDGHVYVMTVDVSRGQSLDFSAFKVFDITDSPYKVVAIYNSNEIPPILYPNVIHKVAKDYNECYVLIELNDIGSQVIDILHTDLEYENVLYSTDGIITEWGKMGKAGLRTTQKSKRIGCSALKSLMENNKIIDNDFDTIVQLSTFIATKKSFEADSGCHDDLVMCLVLFGYLTTQQFFKDITNVNIRNLIYENQMTRIDNELTPYGYIDDGESLLDMDVDKTPDAIWISAGTNYSTWLNNYWNG